jgi:predicted alpha/beta-hydrolase family hydrolase
MPERFPVDVDGGHVTAIAYSAADPVGLTFLLGHGASADQHTPFVVQYAEGLARRGVFVVTYNFPFAEEGRSTRKVPVLEACCRAAIVAARQCHPHNHLFIGGKSLGGRVASRVAAEGGAEMDAVSGLVILGYPLHAVGKPKQRQVQHFSQIRVPVFLAQGSRDAFGTSEELRTLLDELPKGTELCVIEGGDHSFVVPRREADAQDRVHARVQDEIVRWMTQAASRGAWLGALEKPRAVASRQPGRRPWEKASYALESSPEARFRKTRAQSTRARGRPAPP